MQKKILVVDNHPVILKFMRSLLQKEGHFVVTTEDGLSALDILKDFTPDVIFLDLIMPNIGGEKLCRIIRGMPAFDNVYVVIFSAVAAEEEIDFLRLGANACIAKGVFGDMARRVLTVLEQARKGSSHVIQATASGHESFHGRQITRELLAVKRHFEIILESMTEGILEITSETRIVYANPAALSLIGIPEAELLATPLTELFRGNDRKRLECMLHHRTSPLHCSFDDKPYTLRGRLVSVKTLPIKDNPDKSIVMLTDVTEQIRIQKQLQQDQRMEAIGTLAGGVSHAFNNALTVIIGNIALAKNYAKSDERVYRKLEEAERASLKARDLTQRLMPLSEANTAAKQAASIEDLVREACSSALDGIDIQCRSTLPEGLWQVQGNPDQLRQVLHHVIVNAVEATPSGSMIRVSAKNVLSVGENTVDLVPGQYVKVTVQDYGMGIPEEYLSQIYDPYFTTKEMGRGLGLSTAYSIVGNHDGLITASSDSVSGTMVTIYLPAAASEAFSALEHNPPPAASKGKILVMDDDETMREIMGETLKCLGYEGHFASEGSEAIRMYTLAMRSDEPFDAVIMDLSVSNGMGGAEAIRKLLRVDSEAKVIVASGYADDPAMLDCRKHGFRAGLDKPFKVKDLNALLERVIMER